MAKFSQRKETYCYLDLDFDDSRASYKRAVDFVESNSIKYGLSSNVLSELGGREMKSVPELFANDYVWSDDVGGELLTKYRPMAPRRRAARPCSRTFALYKTTMQMCITLCT